MTNSAQWGQVGEKDYVTQIKDILYPESYFFQIAQLVLSYSGFAGPGKLAVSQRQTIFSW